jgi:hypothetical protein
MLFFFLPPRPPAPHTHPRAPPQHYKKNAFCKAEMLPAKETGFFT